MAYVSLRRLVLWGVWVGLAPSVHALMLVTEEEAAQSRAAQMAPVARSSPAAQAPVIQLMAPDTAAAVSSPTRITLRFEPGPQASIRPETFKVFYGALKLDITQRITAQSKVSPQGIEVTEAHLPKGSHRLVLEIQDSAGRIGSRLISFVVD
jgi:hypothetical protein